MTQHPPLPRMRNFVDTAVRVEGIFRWWKHGVELRFLDVGAVSVDGFKGARGVEGEAVGAVADNGAVGVVHVLEGEVTGAVPGVVDAVPVGEFGPEGTWVGGERV